jgi:mannan endo-1,4-beta-mannosidase
MVASIGATVLLASPPITKENHNMLIGVYQPYSPGSYNQVTEFAKEAGFSPRILSYYSTFTQDFAKSFAQQCAANGATVLVQWQPRGATSKDIAAGKFDAYITKFAQDVKSDAYQVILSYGQEFNGNWYSWGAGGSDGSNGSTYIAAWRHIWQIFQKVQAYNVTWLWGPNVQYPGSAVLAAWYPGNAYVDWVGLDGYFQKPTDNFASLFGPSIAALRGVTSKPLLIAESGVSGTAGVAQLNSLFLGAAQAGAVGIVYFDEAQSGDSTHQDWRLENNKANMAAFSANVHVFGTRPLVNEAS